MNNVFDQTTLKSLAAEHGTPLFVYSSNFLHERVQILKQLKLPYGFTPRYAMKANNHPEIIQLFLDAGMSFDASSSYEAEELLQLGVSGDKISLSSQQPAHNLTMLLEAGVKYVATSMRQLELFAEGAGAHAEVGLRVNPGIGSGYNNRLTTGGPNSSFGLWAEYVPQALAFAKQKSLSVTRLHVHVGTGSEPELWGSVMDAALEIAADMPDVTTLDIGGGFKIHYYGDQHEVDMEEIFSVLAGRLEAFAHKTGRQLHLEAEPGRWLVAQGGVLLSEVVDIVDTGADGHTFLRLDTGMNDFMRSSMYGAQHRIEMLNDMPEQAKYIVVGHNCETSDILTPAPGDPEGLEPREMNKASIGDIIVVQDTGAYCRSMSAKGYNSYPSAKEVLI